jgi:hypothetical protein
MKENYPLYVKWFETTDWILETVEKFPKSMRFTLSGRIVNMTLDVLEGIIEAIYTKDRAHILDRINLYMEKLRVLFRIAYKRRCLSTSRYEYISSHLEEAGRMAGGWKKKT